MPEKDKFSQHRGTTGEESPVSSEDQEELRGDDDILPGPTHPQVLPGADGHEQVRGSAGNPHQETESPDPEVSEITDKLETVYSWDKAGDVNAKHNTGPGVTDKPGKTPTPKTEWTEGSPSKGNRQGASPSHCRGGANARVPTSPPSRRQSPPTGYNCGTANGAQQRPGRNDRPGSQATPGTGANAEPRGENRGAQHQQNPHIANLQQQLQEQQNENRQQFQQMLNCIHLQQQAQAQHQGQGALQQQQRPAQTQQTLKNLDLDPRYRNLLQIKYPLASVETANRYYDTRQEAADPTLELLRRLHAKQIERNDKAAVIFASTEDYGPEKLLTQARYQIAVGQRDGIVLLDEVIAKIDSQYTERRETKDSYQPMLQCPPDLDPQRSFEDQWSTWKKQIKEADGSDGSVERCWKRILLCGKRGEWSHEYYIHALEHALTDEAAEFFEDIQQTSLQEVLEELSARFGAREMLSSINELEAFARKPNETLRSAISRLKNAIQRVMPIVDPPQRIHEKENMLKTGLINIASAGAKIKINGMISTGIRQGKIPSFEVLYPKAEEKELAFKDIPKISTPGCINFFAKPPEITPVLGTIAVGVAADTTTPTVKFTPRVINNYSRSMSGDRRSESGRPTSANKAEDAKEDRRSVSRERQSRSRKDQFLQKRQQVPSEPPRPPTPGEIKSRESSTDKMQKEFTRFRDWTKNTPNPEPRDVSRGRESQSARPRPQENPPRDQPRPRQYSEAPSRPQAYDRPRGYSTDNSRQPRQLSRDPPPRREEPRREQPRDQQQQGDSRSFRDRSQSRPRQAYQSQPREQYSSPMITNQRERSQSRPRETGTNTQYRQAGPDRARTQSREREQQLDRRDNRFPDRETRSRQPDRRQEGGRNAWRGRDQQEGYTSFERARSQSRGRDPRGDVPKEMRGIGHSSHTYYFTPLQCPNCKMERNPAGQGNSIVVMCSAHDPLTAVTRLSNDMAAISQESSRPRKDETSRELVPIIRQ